MYISRNLEQWQAFIQLLHQAFQEGKAEEVLMMLLTPDERNALGLRVQIIAQLLRKDIPQREIQHNLNTSAATITRGSNALKSIDPEFLAWVDAILNKKSD
ncbi:Trp operon repressor [Mergibacter septicus]|uniref:Trp operon repressor homolog n=1 Tax=Mergibacter septicus TaxID=221402 RepID=A0A8E3SBL1_9PAST|nr:trp operon repressor [Mergibacter septicus]AWX13172.1 Trp operon repressor [Mergibacter septicus]AWX15075.1 Trp operon repressor [Mergibacter septicus]QDJ12591.1 Trp operon repressor [Mergibacter septicus]QDJ14328.1 Trp operon repressor [Mergibacter septicus]UTU48231.1 trp operon repressor [Mergibacter septicus]